MSTAPVEGQGARPPPSSGEGGRASPVDAAAGGKQPGAPESERHRSGRERALSIAVRTLHLAAMSVVAGGVVLAAPTGVLHPWRLATAATGLVLLVLEASHSRRWALEGRGLVTLAHVAAAIVLVRVTDRVGVALALVLGAVGSHLPRPIRLGSPFAAVRRGRS